MSQLADNTIVFLPESERIVQQNPLPNELDERLVKLIDAAEERIHSMRNKADTEFAKREQRLGKFEASYQNTLDGSSGSLDESGDLLRRQANV